MRRPAMTRRCFTRGLVAAALSPALAARAWPQNMMRSVVGPVTVTVAPDDLSEHLPTWTFALVFESEGPPLDDDLMKSVWLMAGNRRAPPLDWTGDAPGTGRERWVTLRFRAFKPRPTELRMVLLRKGEPHPRVFTWVFGSGQSVRA